MIMAAVMRADDQNMAKIKREWPDLVVEVRQRYNSPGGMLLRERTSKPGKEPTTLWLAWSQGGREVFLGNLYDSYGPVLGPDDKPIGHASSSLDWLKLDVTINFADRAIYLANRYPDGYVLELVDLGKVKQLIDLPEPLRPHFHRLADKP